MATSSGRGLGKGLGALLSQADQLSEDVRSAIVDLKITDISPNSDQPRKYFDQEKLEELAASIRENGVIQPIIVCRDSVDTKLLLVSVVGVRPGLLECLSFRQSSEN